MSKSYLDKNGLAHFWEKIKAYVNSSGVTGQDYIVEQHFASNNLSGYTKWNSGKMETWQRLTTQVNVTTQMAGGLYYGTIQPISYPKAFINYPVVNITEQVQYGYGWLIPSYDDYSVSATGTLYVYYVASKSNVSVTLNISAVGKWK